MRCPDVSEMTARAITGGGMDRIQICYGVKERESRERCSRDRNKCRDRRESVTTRGTRAYPQGLASVHQEHAENTYTITGRGVVRMIARQTT
ncbi:hypothetical protein DPMN_045645 [Dreissena polymorpha]|uniref:Uncharacterized protein n=1 Tax=Dreissena polymorpha TaxID=45954 RepID=A0A9D4I1K3_DREPO|nr:hypothetical protein DPMN_045645 [Dreissena polymorpha]